MIRWGLILCIRLYQVAFRWVLRRKYIYNESCSRYALRRLSERNQSLQSTIADIRQRVTGCGIQRVVLGSTLDDTQAYDRHNSPLHLPDLADHIVDKLSTALAADTHENKSADVRNNSVPVGPSEEHAL